MIIDIMQLLAHFHAIKNGGFKFTFHNNQMNNKMNQNMNSMNNNNLNS